MPFRALVRDTRPLTNSPFSRSLNDVIARAGCAIQVWMQGQ